MEEIRSDVSSEKCTSALTVRLTEEAREHLAACAVIAGMNTGEYARVVLLDHLYGRLARIRMRERDVRCSL